MTFLNSALAWGLLAASLPLLIHLFSRRRFPQIDFSTLRFLRRLQRQQMRKLHLKQWLLLLLRTLAILLIVLAFARPALLLHSAIAPLTTNRIGMAMVMDASASMQAESGSGSCFEMARSAVDSLLSLLNPGDRAVLVLAKGRPELIAEFSENELILMRRALQRAQVWDGSADLSSAVNFAADALRSPAGRQHIRDEIYLFSDFASLPELPAPPQGMIPYFVQLVTETTENLSVQDVKVSSEMIEPGQPVDVEVTLTNHGQKDRENVYYSIFLNDVRAAEDVVTLAAGAQVQRRLQILPQGLGLQAGTIQIDDQDVLSADNRAYFSFSIPELIEVLLIGDAGECRPIRLALIPQPDSEQLISLEQVAADSWEVAPIMRFDVIVFAAAPNFTAAQAVKLQKFVASGGGLLIFPSSQTDIAAVNRELLYRLGTPMWGENMAPARAGEAFLGWQNPEPEEPLLRGMLRPGGRPASPHFFQALHLVGEQGGALLRLANGYPFLSETLLGKGRTILCASSPHLEWSDWAGRGIFAPLMHRLVLRLAGGGQEKCQSLMAGMDLEIPAAADGNAIATLITPAAQEIKLPPQIQGRSLAYRLAQINPAGNYRMSAGASSYLVSVNIPPPESALAAENLLQAYPLWRQAGVYTTNPAELVQTVKDSRYGRELWKAALAGGLLVLLIESLVGASYKSKTEDRAHEED